MKKLITAALLLLVLVSAPFASAKGHKKHKHHAPTHHKA